VGATDLHTHTTASDGSLAPGELVALAADRGLAVLGITDHDTTAGLADARAAAQSLDLTLVDGVELSCDVGQDHMDILGYLIDTEARPFADLLATIRAARKTRARKMVDRLQGLGAAVTMGDVEAIAGGGSLGRPHVAKALVANGFVPDVGAAFDRYIGRDGPAYAERYVLTPAEACHAIRAADGVAVLAHPVPPTRPGADQGRLRRRLEELVDVGLGGLECYYSGYGARVTRWLEALAGHFGLVPTGGSDYHGPWRPDRDLGAVDVPADTLARLRAARDGIAGAG